MSVRRPVLDQMFPPGTQARLEKLLQDTFKRLEVEVEAPSLTPETWRELTGNQTRVVVTWRDGPDQIGTLDLTVSPKVVRIDWIEFVPRYRGGKIVRVVDALAPFFRELGVEQIVSTPMGLRTERAALQEAADRGVHVASDGPLKQMRLDLTAWPAR